MLVGAANLLCAARDRLPGTVMFMFQPGEEGHHGARFILEDGIIDPLPDAAFALHVMPNAPHGIFAGRAGPLLARSEEHTSELQSLMRISYAVFCLKKKKKKCNDNSRV